MQAKVDDGSKPEAIRLENQHRLCYTILGDNLYLPNIQINENAKILDLGTSSGIWAIEMATKFPKATVIGIDISPQQTGQPVPPNCTFMVPPLP
jgi:tRNA G46 methylase TrmB